LALASLQSGQGFALLEGIELVRPSELHPVTDCPLAADRSRNPFRPPAAGKFISRSIEIAGTALGATGVGTLQQNDRLQVTAIESRARRPCSSRYALFPGGAFDENLPTLRGALGHEYSKGVGCIHFLPPGPFWRG
jgi:hypothetical protein